MYVRIRMHSIEEWEAMIVQISSACVESYMEVYYTQNSVGCTQVNCILIYRFLKKN